MFHGREKELLEQLENFHLNEKKFLDNNRNLEKKLQQAQEEADELTLKIRALEGHVTGLEAELAKVESAKRDIEYRLDSLYSTLRRTLGIGRSGRSPSPRRPHSPIKGTKSQIVHFGLTGHSCCL